MDPPRSRVYRAGALDSRAEGSTTDDTSEFELPLLQFLWVSLWAFGLGVICRALDLLWLLARPSLLGPYLQLLLADLRHSPYRWRPSFETARLLQKTGQTPREAMYGEAPLFTAVRLFRLAGLSLGGRLVDPLAGRGRPLLAARWLGADARGIELFPHQIKPVARAIQRAGASLELGDAQTTDFGDATHVFLNWTGLSASTRTRVTERLVSARPGTRFIAVSEPVESPRVRLLSTHRALFSWGRSSTYLQELVEPA